MTKHQIGLLGTAIIIPFLSTSPASLAASRENFAFCASIEQNEDGEDDPSSIKNNVENRCDKEIRAVVCCYDEKAFSCRGTAPFKVLIIPALSKTQDAICRKAENMRVNGCYGDELVLSYEHIPSVGITVQCGRK